MVRTFSFSHIYMSEFERTVSFKIPQFVFQIVIQVNSSNTFTLCLKSLPLFLKKTKKKSWKILFVYTLQISDLAQNIRRFTNYTRSEHHQRTDGEH